MNKINLLRMMLLGAAATAIVSCGDNKAQTSVTEEAVAVRTQRVTVTDYSAPLEYSGTIASASEARLSFKIGGIISKIFVKEGDHVHRGQLLATLDLTEIRAQVRQAQQGVEKAGRDLSRVKNLFADTAATLEQYQNVQTQHNVANENLRIAQFNQQYAQIRASDEGTIIKKIMNEGELASSGNAVLIMNATSKNDWVVRFGVSDKDWALIRKNDVASVSIDAYPDVPFRGVVNKIAAAADPVSGTYEIEVKVLPGEKQFAAGLFATIRLNSSVRTQVTTIPIEALTEADGKKGYVYVLNADKTSVTRRPVEIAFIEKERVAVRSGLDGVTEVITDGLSYLTEYSKVKLVSQPQNTNGK